MGHSTRTARAAATVVEAAGRPKKSTKMPSSAWTFWSIRKATPFPSRSRRRAGAEDVPLVEDGIAALLAEGHERTRRGRDCRGAGRRPTRARRASPRRMPLSSQLPRWQATYTTPRRSRRAARASASPSTSMRAMISSRGRAPSTGCRRGSPRSGRTRRARCAAGAARPSSGTRGAGCRPRSRRVAGRGRPTRGRGRGPGPGPAGAAGGARGRLTKAAARASSAKRRSRVRPPSRPRRADALAQDRPRSRSPRRCAGRGGAGRGRAPRAAGPRPCRSSRWRRRAAARGPGETRASSSAGVNAWWSRKKAVPATSSGVGLHVRLEPLRLRDGGEQEGPPRRGHAARPRARRNPGPCAPGEGSAARPSARAPPLDPAHRRPSSSDRSARSSADRGSRKRPPGRARPHEITSVEAHEVEVAMRAAGAGSRRRARARAGRSAPRGPGPRGPGAGPPPRSPPEAGGPA